jgi:hypothetical protein
MQLKAAAAAITVCARLSVMAVDAAQHFQNVAALIREVAGDFHELSSPLGIQVLSSGKCGYA